MLFYSKFSEMEISDIRFKVIEKNVASFNVC